MGDKICVCQNFKYFFGVLEIPEFFFFLGGGGDWWWLTATVLSGRSVDLSTLFPGQA